MSQDAKKALKGGELGGGGFFSSMGFDAPKEEKKQEQPVEKKEEVKKAEVNKDDLLQSISSSSLGNAKVIRSGPSTSKPNNTRSRTANRTDRSKTRRAGNRPTFQKAKLKTKAVATPANTAPKKKATTSSNLKKKTEITMDGAITAKEFSEKTGVPFPEVMKVMISNKILGGINTNLDYDTAALIGEELGVKIKKEQETVSIDSILEGDLNAILELDKEAENLKSRPPIVTIMGHVDHGKTSLLDYLRKTDVADGEAGGITQSIGASTISHEDKQITFIDTPGHELFTTMRSRGAKLTDIVVIIIAADDGIMPQTIESINHAKEAGVPIIIAITKVDKPGANKQEEIKANIGTYDLIPEEWGGDVPVIEISSKTGQGIDELLEHISLQAEVLELTYNPERNAVGVVLDAQKSAKQGIETSLIILTGKLKVGDIIAVHNTYGKVKRMINRAGKSIKEAHGGDPVQILGINDTPEPGRIAEGVKSEKEASQKIAIIQEKERKESSHNALQMLMAKMESGEKTIVKLILKSNGPTGLEALKHAISTIQTPDNVKIQTIHADIGQFTESDLALASASEAFMIGFNIKTPGSLKKKADQKGITLKNYDIIYELTEYLEDVAMGLIEIKMEEVSIGKLDVLAVFFRKGKEMVIGGKVMEGLAKNGVEFKVWRIDEEAVEIAKGKITSLQRDMQNVKEAKKGYECGMRVRVSKPIEEGDIIEFIEMQEVKE